MVKRQFAVLLRSVLSAAALYALWRELHGLRFAPLMSQVAAVGPARIGVALAATVASFALLGVVEVLALRRTAVNDAHEVPVSSAMTTAFMANALSQSVGVSVLTGAAVRARAYARHGLDVAAVGRVTAFVTITATLGLLAAGAVAIYAAGAGAMGGAASFATRPTALLLAMVVAAYLAWSLLGASEGVGRGRWRLARPSPLLASGQVLISALDWLVTGVVLYAFMPGHTGLTLGLVLGAYMIAQTAGVTSHVPAGAGVFEVVAIAVLTHGAPDAPRTGIVAALVLFRLTYYVLPLCAAMVVAVATRSSHHVTPAVRAGRRALVSPVEQKVRHVA